MTELLETLRSAAQTQFGGGVILMSVLGSAIALLRNTPRKVINLVSRRIFVTVDIQDRNGLFEYVERWLDSLDHIKKSRNLSAKLISWDLTFSPAPGHHFFWVDKVPVWLVRSRVEKESGYATESFILRTLGVNPDPVRKLLQKATAYAMTLESKPGVYTVRWNDWSRQCDVPSRALDTVVLPNHVREQFLEDVELFLNSRPWYEANGIPWRRGYLLEGLPGTGKTSLVTALASERNMNVYICNVATSGMTDEKLMSLIFSVPPKSIVLMEDIDAVLNGRSVESTSDVASVTFAGLLNCLDGLSGSTGVITFMTTNHADKLDAALIRRGRMDYHINFGVATHEQVVRYMKRYYEAAPDELIQLAARQMEGKVIADIQHLVMQNREDIRTLLNDRDNTDNSN